MSPVNRRTERQTDNETRAKT